MKTVIDLIYSPYGAVNVPDTTPVRTEDGIHYLLTPEEQSELDSRISEWESLASERALKDVYDRRCKSLSEGGYGTSGEQFDMIYHSGIDTWKAHIEQVKLNYPKPA